MLETRRYNFQLIHRPWEPQYTSSQTDRQTDRQTTVSCQQSIMIG